MAGNISSENSFIQMNFNLLNYSFALKTRSVLKRIIPKPVKRAFTGLFYGWHGNFSSWKEASERCTGYDNQVILDEVTKSALIVKEGKAAFERDSVTYQEPEYNFPVLSVLLLAASENNNRLNVLDFGGSLGSTYYQNRFFLDSISELNWCVVEQEKFVKAGSERFADNRLHFFNGIEDCLDSYVINAVLLSSVLQYLEEPYLLIQKLIDKGIRYIIIDRTPFIKTRTRLTIQKVHPAIYKATYPCWFFNEDGFNNVFSLKYKLIYQFQSLDEANIKSKFGGFVYQSIAI